MSCLHSHGVGCVNFSVLGWYLVRQPAQEIPSQCNSCKVDPFLDAATCVWVCMCVVCVSSWFKKNTVALSVCLSLTQIRRLASNSKALVLIGSETAFTNDRGFLRPSPANDKRQVYNQRMRKEHCWPWWSQGNKSVRKTIEGLNLAITVTLSSPRTAHSFFKKPAEYIRRLFMEETSAVSVEPSSALLHPVVLSLADVLLNVKVHRRRLCEQSSNQKFPSSLFTKGFPNLFTAKLWQDHHKKNLEPLTQNRRSRRWSFQGLMPFSGLSQWVRSSDRIAEWCFDALIRVYQSVNLFLSDSDACIFCCYH